MHACTCIPYMNTMYTIYTIYEYYTTENISFITRHITLEKVMLNDISHE